MHYEPISFTNKDRRTIIFAVTLGNLLEWYEIYLYVYWAPIIAKLFFHASSDTAGLIHTFLVFSLGFLARPLGGIFFGRIGDLVGRKKSLVLSLMVMIFPTFITGFLPTYAQIGVMAPIILASMRILQAFPAGGELPGAFCYLYESSPLKSRRYMSSWGAVGYQMGILISTVECLFLEKYLSTEALMTWGWRVSFLAGGIIGFLGLFLRYKLRETPLYLEMEIHSKIVKEPIMLVLRKQGKKILLGILFCALNSSTFYLLSINFPVCFSRTLSGVGDNLIVTIFLLILITLPLPWFGMIADRVNNKKLLIVSTVGMMLLLYPLYIGMTSYSIWIMGITIVIFGLFFTMTSALIPFIICDLFHTRERFTCSGMSFNVADAVIGGFTPVAALYLSTLTGNQASFCWILFACGLLSLAGYIMMQNKKPVARHL